MMVRRLLLAVSVGALAGCSAIANVGSASRPLDTYELSPLSALPGPVRGTRHLVVELPTASGALATDRIAVKEGSLQVAYMPGARWADPAPDHVQLLLARSIGSAGGFALVSTGSGAADPDWSLATDLQAFQVELDPSGAARVRVRLRATLIDENDRSVRGASMFEASAPVADTGVAAVIPAFDRATSSVLREATAWVGAAAG